MPKARIFTVLFISLMSALVYAGFASASDQGFVTATVTVQNISVSMEDGDIEYGILALNSSASPVGDETQDATNDGNVAINLEIRGQNSGSWTLAGTNGENQYVHRFCTATCGSPPTNFTALTTGYQTLSTGVATSASTEIFFHLTTPTTSASYTEQEVDVQVLASMAS